jgi:hypothetical protein
MGIYLDTVEDNDELAGWRVEAIRQKLGIPSPPPRIFPSFECPACIQFFFTEQELNDHIFTEHRRDYIRIDSQIIREDTYLNLDETDQSRFVQLEQEIISLQVRIDKNNRSIDDLWPIYDPSSYSPIQEQYLFGFLEYLRAHDLEVNRHSSDFNALSRHFGTAYGKLQPFSTLLAQQIRRAVAFKMNWFREHKEVPESSLFFLAWHFFTHSYEDVTAIHNLPMINNRRQQGIVLDGFHSEILEAIQYYYCDRSKLNYNWLHKLERLADGIANRNYLDKLQLFKARLYRDWQDFEQAKAAYRSIKSHPEFGREASCFND